MIELFIPGDPPRATQQQHRISINRGYPVVYDSENVKEARQYFYVTLSRHRPKVPLDGPLELTVHWRFQAKSHKPNEWKVSRPDIDNSMKLLQDCMTKMGFWKDDSQIAHLDVYKYWSKTPGLYISIRELNKYREEIP